ncbi:MAG: hypothetical protein AABZ53_10825, partial [Planctomycetota bacterium]
MPIHHFVRTLPASVVASWCSIAPAACTTSDPQPIAYTISMPAPESHLAHIKATIPTQGSQSLDLFIPVWSPGFYHKEDHAAKVTDLSITAPDA